MVGEKMNRVVVKMPNGYCNLEADAIDIDGDIIEVYNKSDLVGIFNKAYVFCCYKTNKVPEEKSEC